MESRSSLSDPPPFIRLARRVNLLSSVITNSISVLDQADPIFSFSAVVWLEFKLEYGATVASVFHAVKHAFKACFLG